MKPRIEPGEKRFVRRWLRGNGKWSWCLHCERAWSTKKLGKTVYCPAEDCDGSPIDFWSWGQVRAANPHYPSDPIEGGIYPMYGGRP